MRYLAILCISFYQKWISPYKGFRCAHAVLHKKKSCSEEVKLIIKTHGLLLGYSLIKSRFADCRNAYHQLTKEDEDKNKKREKDKNKWYDGCDPSSGCDVFNCVPKKGCTPDLPCDCSLF